MNIDQQEEKVSHDYDEAQLLLAQAVAWQVLGRVATQIKPGMKESDAHKIYNEISSAEGATAIWHPPQIRFGKNTNLTFGKRSDPEVVLQNNDIFFMDIGPVYEGYEGDVGQTYVLGDQPQMHLLAKGAQKIFKKAKEQYLKNQLTGIALYEYIQSLAKESGWEFAFAGAAGHRLADFPHSAHYRGKLKDFARTPTPNHWILEVHLIDPKTGLGAFFEDLL
jgi:Xaa-Pro aminopeptidase